VPWRGCCPPAAGAAAWAAWPQPGVGHATESQFHVIATVLLLAGLPLLSRRFFGPPSPSRAGRSLRVVCWAAILALLPGLTVVEAFANLTPAQPAYRYIYCVAQGWSDTQGCAGVPGRSTGGSALGGRDRAVRGGTPGTRPRYRHRSVAAGIGGRSAGGAGLDHAGRRAGRGPGGAALPRSAQ
jgi:hypothetical protein